MSGNNEVTVLDEFTVLSSGDEDVADCEVWGVETPVLDRVVSEQEAIFAGANIRRICLKRELAVSEEHAHQIVEDIAEFERCLAALRMGQEEAQAERRRLQRELQEVQRDCMEAKRRRKIAANERAVFTLQQRQLLPADSITMAAPGPGRSGPAKVFASYARRPVNGPLLVEPGNTGSSSAPQRVVLAPVGPGSSGSGQQK